MRSSWEVGLYEDREGDSAAWLLDEALSVASQWAFIRERRR